MNQVQEQESARVFLCQEQRELAISSFAFNTSHGETGEFFSLITPYHNCLSEEIGSFTVNISDGFRHIRIKELVSLMDTKFSVNIAPFAKVLWGYILKRGIFTPGFEARRGFFVSEGISLSREFLTYFNFENDENLELNICFERDCDAYYYHFLNTQKKGFSSLPLSHETRSIPPVFKKSEIHKVCDIYHDFPWLFRQMFGKVSLKSLPDLWQKATLDLRGLNFIAHRLVFLPLAVDFVFSFVDSKKNDNHADINKIQITGIRIYVPNGSTFHSFLVR